MRSPNLARIGGTLALTTVTALGLTACISRDPAPMSTSCGQGKARNLDEVRILGTTKDEKSLGVINSGDCAEVQNPAGKVFDTVEHGELFGLICRNLPGFNYQITYADSIDPSITPSVTLNPTMSQNLAVTYPEIAKLPICDPQTSAA